MRGNSYQKSKKPKNFIFEIIVSSCLETTAHGIGPLLKRKSWIIRIFWFICLIASTVVCVYLVTTGIISFLEFDTVTKTEKIHLISTNFPAVSICNTNSFLTNASSNFVMSLFTKDNLKIDPYNVTANDIFILRYFTGTNALDPNRTDAFRQSLSPGLSDIIFSCTFNLQPCSLESDFFWYFDNFYGNCFTFNSGK